MMHREGILFVLSTGFLLASFQKVNSIACHDYHDKCPQWGESGFCNDGRFSKYMSKNCRKSCNLCGICADDSTSCPYWSKKGYCSAKSFKKYMTRTCPRSCGLCGDPVTTKNTPITEITASTQPLTTGDPVTTSGQTTMPVTEAPTTTQPPSTTSPITVGPQGSVLDGCSFSHDFCQWINVPFDDALDFQIKSNSSGNGGPNAGMIEGDGYAYVSSSKKYSWRNAKLLLPMEIILDHGSNHGTLCMSFAYFIAESGKLYLKEVKNIINSPTSDLLVIRGSQGNQWKTTQINVEVSTDRQLMFEASVHDSVIAIDEIRFSDSRCA